MLPNQNHILLPARTPTPTQGFPSAESLNELSWGQPGLGTIGPRRIENKKGMEEEPVGEGISVAKIRNGKEAGKGQIM